MDWVLPSLKKCFSTGLLRKVRPKTELAIKDVLRAEFFLDESISLLTQGKREIAAISLYNAYFHTARALLDKDGVTERSHACVVEFVKEKYAMKNKMPMQMVTCFEQVLLLRHDVQYSAEPIEIDEDLAELCDVCQEFITRVRRLIE
jgi:uncharacterized protein (UPF0332 family)